jgi:hypothetical protein
MGLFGKRKKKKRKSFMKPISLKKVKKFSGKVGKKAKKAVKAAPGKAARRAGRMAVAGSRLVDAGARTVVNTGQAVGEVTEGVGHGLYAAGIGVGGALQEGYHHAASGANVAHGLAARGASEVKAGAQEFSLNEATRAKASETRAKGKQSQKKQFKDARKHQTNVKKVRKFTGREGKKQFGKAKKHLTSGVKKETSEAVHSAAYGVEQIATLNKLGHSDAKAEHRRKVSADLKSKSGGKYAGADSKLDALIGAASVPGVGVVGRAGMRAGAPIARSVGARVAPRIASRAGRSGRLARWGSRLRTPQSAAVGSAYRSTVGKGIKHGGKYAKQLFKTSPERAVEEYQEATGGER